MAQAQAISPRSPIRRLGHALDAAAVLLVVVLLGLGGAYWWVTRPAPGLDGKLRLAGLNGVATITRDGLGVPYIQATNLHDLFLVEGFAMAQDRLWQMDAIRRAGEGTLAEVFGAPALDNDERTRRLGLDRAAAAEAARLGPEDRAELQAFSEGVNLCIAGNGCRLPLEFRVMRYRPAAWRPQDSLALAAYMYQVLASGYLSKLERETFAAQLPTAVVRDIFPDHSPWDIIPGMAPPAPAAPAPRPAVAALQLPPVFAAPPVDWSPPGGDLKGGSNNWVLAGQRSLTGKPILANDPHLVYRVPGMWWAAELSAPELHAAGVTLPGFPGIIIGHNDRIAWGATVVRADVQDLFREQLDGRGNYRTATGWAPLQHWQEQIPVRGGKAVAFEVTATAHGPIVAHDGGGPLALDWSLYAPRALDAGGVILRVDQAHDWNEFEAALSGFAGPALNFVYADVDGHIGYQAAGWVPLRPKGDDGSVPVPGNDGRYDWKGWIPFAQMPRALDPANGELATANGRVTPDNYPYTISTVWDAPNRTRRIYQMLDQLPRWNPSAMARLQTDVFSEEDRDFAAAVVAAAQTQAAAGRTLGASTNQALALLRAFRGGMGRSSVAPTLAFETREEFLLRVLTGRLGPELAHAYHWDEAPVVVQALLAVRPAEWLPAAYKDRGWDALLVDALTAVAERHQLTAADARWGKFETLDVLHPLWSNVPLLKKVADLGPVEINGSPLTVKQARSTWLGDENNLGPSMRFVADLSDWDRTTLTLFAGESGEITSPHYRDQFNDYLQGKALPLWFSPGAVAAHAAHRENLAAK